MALEIGILIGLALMLFWGFGDFFMQKVIRKFGDVETLLLLSVFGFIVLFPLVLKYSSWDLALKDWLIVSASAVILCLAAFLLFEGMKRGKLDVVEPLFSLELIAAIALSAFLLHEAITGWQYFIILILLIGLVLVSLRSFNFERKDWMEKGVLLVIAGSLFMGTADFLIGYGSRLSDPLLVNWIIDIVCGIVCLVILLRRKRTRKVFRDSIKAWKIVLPLVILDTIAWLIYSYAMTKSPIAIVTALSESYIVIAVLLGIYVNKEYLKLHQKIGLVLAIIAAIVLAVIS
jgi:drug/metabolite transporter (DMT)-like permease